MRRLPQVATLCGALALSAAIAAPALAANPLSPSSSPAYDTTGEKFGSGALVAGANSFGYLPSATAFFSTSAFTWSAWVKLTSTASGYAVAMGSENDGFLGVASGNYPACNLNNVGTVTGAAAIPSGAWHHLEMDWTGSTLYCFLDGASVGSKTGTFSPYSSSYSALEVGAYGASPSGTGSSLPLNGEVDEASVWNGAQHTAAFTPASAAYAGTEGMVALYHLDRSLADSAVSALASGTLTISAGATAIKLVTSAGLSGGSGAGYTYAIYRSTSGNFSENAGSLLASGLSGAGALSYTDAAVSLGQLYYYGVVGSDGGGNTVSVLLPGIGAGASRLPYYVAAQLNGQDVAMVGVGDSITYGYGVTGAGTTGCCTALYYAAQRVAKAPGAHTVYLANGGQSGSQTSDWVPGASSGYYTGVIAASNASSQASVLFAAHPGAKKVFNLMLGTNDVQYQDTTASTVANLDTLIARILSDWPGATVMVHLPPFFVPTNNASPAIGYGLQQALAAALSQVASTFAASNPGQVFLGDTSAYAYFAQTFQSELQVQAIAGVDGGDIVLHPNAAGSLDLGEFWGRADAQALFAAPVATPAFRSGFRW